MFHRSWSIVVLVVPSCGPSRLFSSLQSVSVSVESSLETLYQSFHCSQPGVVSVDPSLAVSCFISRSIARGRALYQSFHRSRSGAVSVVPALPVVTSLAVSRCISSSIACSQSSYPWFHRLQLVFASVVPSLRLAALYQLFHPSCSIISVVPSYQSFHRSRAVVVPLVP